MQTQRAYFVNNVARMVYATMVALNRPLESGAVEREPRRVVNLLLKGPGMFWYKDHAEPRSQEIGNSSTSRPCFLHQTYGR